MPSTRKTFPHEAGADPRLLAYLDRLSEPLEKTLSPDELAEYRLQALGHLEMLAKELQDFEGLTPGESVDRALREYGVPDLLAIGLLDEHAKGSRPVGFVRGTRSATLWAFVWFGLASAATLSLVVLGSMMPGWSFLNPALPTVGIFAPILAGYLTGRTVPTGNLRSVLIAVAVLVPHAAATVALMGDFERPDLRPAVLLWPLLGALSTYLTALLRRRPRTVSHDRLAI